MTTQTVAYRNTHQADEYVQASGTISSTRAGKTFVFDSTWTSTCSRRIVPSETLWAYVEHSNWLKTENLGVFMPPIPFTSLRTAPEITRWSTDKYSQSEVVAVSEPYANGVSFAIYIDRETDLVRREEFLSHGDVYTVVDYKNYGEDKVGDVHTDRADCEGRNP